MPWCRRERLLFPSLADAGFLIAVPLALAGILVFFGARAGLTSRIRAVVDALIVGSGMLLASWLTVLGPVYRGGTGSGFAQAIGLAYPVGDVVLLSALLIVAGRSRSVERMPVGWIGAAFVALAVSDSAFAYLTQVGSYGAGQLADTGWVIGYLVLALAAIRAPTTMRAQIRRGERTLLPYLPMIAAIEIFAVRTVEGKSLGEFERAGFLFLVLCLVVRQVLTLRENGSLTRGLEAKVQARTVELRHSEQRLRSLVRNVSDVISVVSPHGEILYVSPSVRDVLGYQAADLMDTSLFELVHQDDRSIAVAFLADPSLSAGAVRRVELRILGEDGGWRDTETIAGDAVDDSGQDRFVLTTRDVTERRQLERQLEHQAFHDPLTGLANRSLFTDRVNHALARTLRSGTQLAVLFVDLDEFKTVNDTLGHGPGDELLREIAHRLTTGARPSDTIARFGGDEFAILLEDCDEQGAIHAAERLHRALAAPITLSDTTLTVSASTGIAIGGPSTESIADLLRNADIAMYRAKGSGEGRYQVFQSEMREAIVRRVNLQNDLAHALAHGEFELHYQPLVELSTRRLVGFEARPLEPPNPWARVTSGLHPRRGGNQADHSAGPMGAARSRQPACYVDRPDRPRPEDQRQRIGTSAASPHLLTDVETSLNGSGVLPSV